jgi:hypothetical protein
VERICSAGGLPSGTCRRLMTRCLPGLSAHLNHTLAAVLELILAARTPSLKERLGRTQLGFSRQENEVALLDEHLADPQKVGSFCFRILICRCSCTIDTISGVAATWRTCLPWRGAPSVHERDSDPTRTLRCSKVRLSGLRANRRSRTRGDRESNAADDLSGHLGAVDPAE